MNLTLYRLVLWLALPLVLLRLYWRARREPAYGERVGERFGRVPAAIGRDPIWFHTVSAGETIAAAPLIRSVVDEFPEEEVLVTTMTPTGSGEVAARLEDAVWHCYAPYDFTFAVRRFFDRVAPKLLVLMETELWPNLVAEAERRGVPVLCVNARLSERSARGYARLGRLTGEMLARIKFIACQTAEHRTRFVELGAPPDRVAALGSVKFDVELSAVCMDEARALEARFGTAERSAWIAASTHPGEDEHVLEAFSALRREVPEALLLLVPRHPVRADEVAGLAEAAGYHVARQSAVSIPEGVDVIVGDVMGTLLALYGVADVAFVGGSFVPVGGHNPIEPALWRIPVLTGPEQFNFPDVMADLEAAGGLQTVIDAQALADALITLMLDAGARAEMGRRGYDVVVESRGATERVLELLRAEIRAAAA